MKLDGLKELIDKIPTTLLLVIYFFYLGYNYYSFESDETSLKSLKIKEIATLKDVTAKLKKKYNEMNDFVKSLDQKKVEMRGLAGELQEAKAVLTENVDVPGFMKMVTTEARKLNFSILGLKPTGSSSYNFYSNLTFSVQFRGVFVQLASFLQRLSSLTRIIEVDNLKLKVIGPNNAKFVMLEGSMDLKVFKYLGSAEDSLGKSESPSTPVAKKGAGP